jgi:hypothetical protein
MKQVIKKVRNDWFAGERALASPTAQYQQRLRGPQFFSGVFMYYMQHNHFHRLDGPSSLTEFRREWEIQSIELPTREIFSIGAMGFVRTFNTFDYFERYGAFP